MRPLVTIVEAIQKGAAHLEKHRVESPRLQAELLLAHLRKLPRLRLYLQFDSPLSVAEEDAYRELLVRRGRRVPLQHLLGGVSFCGIELAVNANVLIPRPETELLAEQAWKWLLPRGAGRFLDLGTGSGCLAIALAVNCPAATGVAVDVSPEALAVARANAGSAGVAARLEFREGDLCQPLQLGERFDLLVSNPPYIASGELAGLEPEVRDHDPRLALDGGGDGLDFYRRLAVAAAPFLAPDGRAFFEIGSDQGASAPPLFSNAGWRETILIKDHTGRDRVISALPPLA